jgi:glycosyltransferase involved in cell wall biosynthesis
VRRLLIVTNRLPVSANDPASPFVLDFVAALTKQGVVPEVFTSEIGEPDGDLGFPVHRFSWGEDKRTLSELPLYSLASWEKIRNYFRCGRQALIDHLKTNKYDHILALWALPSGWFAQQAQLECGVPFSIWALGTDINVWASRPLAGKMIREALAGATALFADGDDLAEKVEKISGKECRFLPSMRRFDLPIVKLRREKFFLYLGRIEKSKGVFDLLKAFSKIKQDIWDYRLLYIGEGSALPKLRKQVARMRLRGKVHLLGRVPVEEIVDYLQRARALVIPTHSDSIPLVFGEALQTATPMIVTEVGDLGTLVRDNKLGVVAPKKSIGNLTDAMIRMIVQEYDITAEARKLVDRFAPERAASTFLEVVNASR